MSSLITITHHHSLHWCFYLLWSITDTTPGEFLQSNSLSHTLSHTRTNTHTWRRLKINYVCDIQTRLIFMKVALLVPFFWHSNTELDSNTWCYHGVTYTGTSAPNCAGMHECMCVQNMHNLVQVCVCLYPSNLNPTHYPTCACLVASIRQYLRGDEVHLNVDLFQRAWAK